MRSLVAALTIVSSLLVGVGIRHAAPLPVQACSGGHSLEGASVKADLIALVDTLSVGDAINRAPPEGATPSSPPAPTPSSPPAGELTHRRFSLPAGFTLVGYGATVQLVSAYAGQPPADPFEVDKKIRASIEREARDYEAGRHFTSCEVGAFTFKFQPATRYLLFAEHLGPASDLYTRYLLPVVGSEVLLTDSSRADNGRLQLDMSAEAYHRFFEGLPGGFNDEADLGWVDAEHVPLRSVLLTISLLRGDPTIAPPNTGTAGLKPPR